MRTENQPVDATLYRHNRGGLAEAMETVCEVTSFEHLVSIIHADREGWPDQYAVTLDTVAVSPYGFDARINWNTYVVTVSGAAVGFTNGPLTRTT